MDTHLQSVIAKVGRIDVLFNAIGIPNTTLQGVPLVDLAVEQFFVPIAHGDARRLNSCRSSHASTRTLVAHAEITVGKETSLWMTKISQQAFR